ncbi:MAG: hypothetical protein Q7S40_11490 [Opitutaceae bacterium]|nr:hypothetical protein [Opitutaceae bacterium]
MKKSSFLTVAITSLVFAGLAFAGEGKVENKTAGCCTKAQKADKTCEHPCCVDAAKKGDNCTKCKGSGKIEQKPAKQ